jgi:hypothetical protein
MYLLRRARLDKGVIKARVRHAHPDASQGGVRETEIARAEFSPSTPKWVLLEALRLKLQKGRDVVLHLSVAACALPWSMHVPLARVL